MTEPTVSPSEHTADPAISAAPHSGPSLHTLTHLAYGLFALGVVSVGVFGVATLAAVVLAYLKRPDTVGTPYYAHLDWLLSTFWWAMLWLLISAIATWLYIGWIGVIATTLWLTYRLIKGWLALCEARAPMSNI